MFFEGREINGYRANVPAVQIIPRRALLVGERLRVWCDVEVVSVTHGKHDDVFMREHKLKVIEADVEG